MGEFLYRLRYPRPILTIRSVARELWDYGRALRRPARGRSPNFVVFAAGRSGSSLLMDLLNSHPGVHCDDEILSHRVLSVDRFLAVRAVLAGRAAYGFKLKLHHLTTQRIRNPGDFLGRLHAEGCCIVHLARRDLLRQALSSGIARQRLAPHQTGTRGNLRSGPFRIDPGWLLGRMRELDLSLRGERAALASLPHLGLCYEDDLLRAERHQATLDRVFDFLGVESAPVASRYVRTGADRLADLVANLDEIGRALRATEYAALVPGPG
jgi:hypothetical protein